MWPWYSRVRIPPSTPPTVFTHALHPRKDGYIHMVTLRSGVLLGLTVLIALLAGLAVAACDSSDDEERLAAQRLFRNYLVQSDRTAVADVRIQGAVDELPPSFPERESLELLGSAFTDTENTRELIFGWQSTEEDADDLYLWYRSQLDVAPWSVESDPRHVSIDFIRFRDVDNPSFRGELRISQEGDRAIVILITTEDLRRRDET